ncbi:MAG: hypothetical protein CFH28_00057 [Alphaproteobacteria bacterium MarineAlpha6_Bin6]|nr:MAG: hypothetical protein CFH28_00057 [Alphaproteobacteria bacterium MarineAlpha6_Bin6]PPR34030.1 MAG: hypothetical protein CFH27_00328 [Alphaproteobacteria bacterium MarineAlpha6_Bin5]|tara:strand:- start:997 stop:1569 length:573 start_codon:yes stop_codon:yes gene_type:complete
MKNYFLNKKLFYIFILFFVFFKSNLGFAENKIYLDLSKIKFENKINYKDYQTSTQLLTKTNLDLEINNWFNKNIVLKGSSGTLTVQILDESIIDNYVEKHKKKFSFLPKDGIAYKINIKVKLIAENKNNNAKGEVLSIVKGDKTFLGGFSINDRSKAIDELMNNMIIRLKLNLRNGMDKEFRDFLTNKYN